MICRAGAATVTELCAWGRGSVLIPYPYATDDHQRKNAEVIVRHGAGRMFLNAELTGKRLAEEIIHLYHDRREREKMEQGAVSLGRPDAALRIVDECYAVLGMN